MSDTLLLATFVRTQNITDVIDAISLNFDVVGNKLFMLQDVANKQKKIITYNINKDRDVVFSDVIQDTISLHRKKETNTLYTLNALNEVVKEQNGGELNKSFSVDWNVYQNTLLITYKDDVTGEMYLKKISTRLLNIVNL
jgi:hypothetical protein|tara:strand:+ start:1702 stop:2121 length:420 start_codon:yes stop_codon:yes gene_type:complete